MSEKIEIEDIEVKIEKDNVKRIDENWHERNEALVSRWRDHCVSSCKEHEKAARHFSRKNKQYGFPTALLPAIAVLISACYEGSNLKDIIAPITFLSSVSSVIYGVMSPAGRSEKHWSFNAQYGEIASLIDAELSRAKQFRRPPDMFMAEFGTRINCIDGNAPPSPGMGWLPDIFCCRKEKEEKMRKRMIDEIIDV